MDKTAVPTEKELKSALGKSYKLWKEIRDQDSSTDINSLGEIFKLIDYKLAF